MSVFKSIYGLGFALMLVGLVFPLILRGGQVVTTMGEGSDVF